MDLSVNDHGSHKSFRMCIPLLIFIVFMFLFVALRSNNLYTVDGAFRCFEVYRQDRLTFDINNHLLYLVNIFAWMRFSNWLGIQIDTPLQFYSQVEIMNCLAGAGCLAILCHFLFLATKSRRYAIVGTVSFGLTRAFIAQSTNSNQPMVGIFWSFVALYFSTLSVRRNSLWPACVAGFFFALAMATYQSTILLASVSVLLMFAGSSRKSMRTPFNRHQLLRFGIFALTGIVATISIFVLAYRRMGVGSSRSMLRYFFWHQESRVYLKMSIGKLLNVPVGMLRNIFPILPSYNGLSSLVKGRDFASLASLALVGLSCGALTFCIVRLWNMRDRLESYQRIALLASAVGFAFTMLPVGIYDPMYDKLWIQPLACLTVFLTVTLRVFFRASMRSSYLTSIIILFMAGVCANLGWVVKAHFSEPYQIAEAQQLARILGNQDLLVGDWDEISVLYGSLIINKNSYFSFPSEAVIHGGETGSRLRAAISKTKSGGGQIYFLSILDQQKEVWNSYLGSRCGVPYETLQIYRDSSTIRQVFRSQTGDIVLREIDPTALN